MSIEFLGPRRLFATDEDVKVFASLRDISGALVSGGVIQLEVFGTSSLAATAMLELTDILGVHQLVIPSSLIPGEADLIVRLSSGLEDAVVHMEKAPYRAAAELLLEKNTHRVFLVSDDHVPQQNVVRGALLGSLTEVKTSAQDTFDMPVDSFLVGYVYREPSPRSDIIETIPTTSFPVLSSLPSGFFT